MKSYAPFAFVPLDWHLAEVLCPRVGAVSEKLALAVMLASKRSREGHVCASLSEVAGHPMNVTELAEDPLQSYESWPELGGWLDELSHSELVTRPNDLDPEKPLVLSGDLLYLTRYYLHELTLARRIRERMIDATPRADSSRIRQVLDRLYTPGQQSSEQQRLAVALALLSRLCVVTGGPGTGKTTVIVRLLSVLVEQSFDEGHGLPRISLLAPTGKAASRIAESIRQSKAWLAASDTIKSAIPDSATTIHRALGLAARPGTQSRQALAADIVIVDEASMVDLALMRRLFDACAHVPRLVLLGDAEQLESVLAGSVLLELTSSPHGGYSRARAAQLSAMTGLDVPANGREAVGLDDCRVELTFSHRFAAASGIGRLAQAVRSGSAKQAWDIVQSGCDGVRFIELGPKAPRDFESLRELTESGYQAFRAATTPERAVEALAQFRVLCGHRQGRFGVEALNVALAESRLSKRSAIPILVTENAPHVALFNGDVGVLWPEGNVRRAYVSSGSGNLRTFSNRRLPAHELAFAMTVHKSQGSEVERLLLVLPNVNSPLLTRELLYTAITRAKQACTIIGTRDAFFQACERRTRRHSGLSSMVEGGA